MAFKSEGKEMYHIFVFAELLVKSLQSGKVWQACIQQTEKPLPHKLCRFTSSLCSLRALLVQHLQYIVYFCNIWFGMVQHQKQFGCRKIG